MKVQSYQRSKLKFKAHDSFLMNIPKDIKLSSNTLVLKITPLRLEKA